MYGDLALFSGNANRPLAEEIAQALGTRLRGADVFQFANENIFVRLHSSVRSDDVFIVQSMSVPVHKHIMELLIFLDTVRRDSAGRITAVVPYYAYGRTDKKDQPRVPITARLLADLITVAGADRVLTMDLHAGQIQGFFTIPVDEITAFHLLSDYFIEKQIPNLVVVAADIGAAKKSRNFAAALDAPLAIVEKRRALDGDRAAILNLIGDVAGCNTPFLSKRKTSGVRSAP
jgi:ribose-phosphate pyrophosphokinase